MTLPAERARSVLYTREFLLSLTDPKATPKVPKPIRQKAIRLLRHYPWECHIKEVLKDND
jgi:hypothetical protein